MPSTTAEIVICGAGIAGIAAAYELAVQRGVRDVVLVEQGQPLSLTSDKSTEAYRNWWPDPAMVAFMNRSIDLLEQIADQTENRIQLNRRGYLYVTGNAAGLPQFQAQAEAIARQGAGRLRTHTPGNTSYQPAPAHGYANQPDGADLILDPAMLREQFPFLSDESVAALHVRRAGWFSAQQLGMYLLEQARAHGVRLINGRISAIQLAGGRVAGVRIVGDNTVDLATRVLVCAAGPLQHQIGQLLGLDLPIYNELHFKIAINDSLQAVPRNAPLTIWNDPIMLDWSEEEQADLATDPELAWLLQALPGGVHGRPEGSVDATTLLLLWDYHTTPVAPVFPFATDPMLTELVLRGMCRMVPGLKPYTQRIPQAYIDGGYYTRTRENRPLIGPLPVEGAFITGAYSGYGLMAACAGAELLAAHVTENSLPEYASSFHPSRYDDPDYQAQIAIWGADGQL